ncbi:type II toxin-antitoxin system prevent-host-death family antitoxin [Nocardia sp. NBC_01730]|uniref:type II toxin-antitoxin system Phd/YefM family antitoxin n=1 Tax=unclassified Nocardia TaxID=2637762 RepID=UPI002E151910|nr:type II toxin-antitoxin system prevent-host-death family antitoxin [Nocardia sp. NBC_01730]WSY60109.1 type II toxin-antitoxin system prevent-host-death family antitoxin [Nocardia sp. NBC_00881]
MAEAITVSEARKHLFPLVKRVNEDHDTVEIVSKSGQGNAVLMSKEDYDSLITTLELLSDNGPRLLKSIAQARAGRVHEHELLE